MQTHFDTNNIIAFTSGLIIGSLIGQSGLIVISIAILGYYNRDVIMKHPDSIRLFEAISEVISKNKRNV